MAEDYISELGLPFLAHRLMRLSELFLAGSGRWLTEAGISAPPRCLSTLLLLRRESGLSVTEVAERLRFTHSLAITLLGELEAWGFTETNRDPQDGRRRLITLTSDGLREAEKVQAATEVIGRAYGALFAETDQDLLAAVSQLERACEVLHFDQRLRREGAELAEAR